MKRISKVTKRDIYELFNKGISTFDRDVVYYNYNGRLEDIDFLKRLYDLNSIQSYDNRFNNAEKDIWQHTLNNKDYEDDWIFNDERFELFEGTDEKFLEFICEIFHPEVRDENKDWKLFFENINELINKDGYELYEYNKISGREIYSWRKYIEKPSYFIPFSQRNQELIKNGKIKIRLAKKTRYQIYQCLKSYNESLMFVDETNFNYTKSVVEVVFEYIEKFYELTDYKESKNEDINHLENFITNGKKFSVFDAIETFYLKISSNKEEYREKINAIFNLNKIEFVFDKGELSPSLNTELERDSSIPIKEAGIEELLKEAEEFYKDKKFSIAVEKIWDVFERIKTYYYPELDKKHSAEKIIIQLSSNNNDIKILFEKEFKELTKIGNEFRIRHHEKNKINISEDKHYEYLYKRCFSLITIVLKIF